MIGVVGTIMETRIALRLDRTIPHFHRYTHRQPENPTKLSI